MPPKHAHSGHGALDFEAKVDEIAKLLRNFVELKSGFGEDHAKARTLNNILKQFDVDHQGHLDGDEFARTLDYMNINCSADERVALFNRYDVRGAGRLQFKELADAIFGLTAAPLGNPEARSIVRKVTDLLKARVGDNGIRGLSRMFSIMDKNRDQEVSKEELFNGLQRYGVQVTLSDVDVIIKHFDRDGHGCANLGEFQRALRGHMSKRRTDIVRQAYAILDLNGDQNVTLGELGQRFQADRHPQVLKGAKTVDEVLQDFASGWDKSGDGIITWPEFLDYYHDISAGIDNEEYFELMIRNVWHISGGEGNAANTSCRRVLVTFKDGRQLIEEIKNDLGITANDKELMKAALEKQGLRDIVKIEAYA